MLRIYLIADLLDIDAGTGGVDVDSTGSINLSSTQATNQAIFLGTASTGGITMDAGDIRLDNRQVITCF